MAKEAGEKAKGDGGEIKKATEVAKGFNEGTDI